MKILLIGATGMIGSRIAAEARARGHEVTPASRSGKDGIALDVTDPAAVTAAAAGHDAVVSAISPPRDGSDPAAPLLAAYRSLLDGLRVAAVRRLIVVGGAGSLRTPSGQDRVDTPDFHELYKPEALAQREVLRLLRADAGDLDWTYVSPADVITPGERTGTFRLGRDDLLYAPDGSSRISAEDYAVALVDEAEKGEAIRRRITVAY
ncbi:NAD(P)-dependent oxidoreductase [Streptomyces sp. 4F14]|uniref:NAD(P)-dependent oxidoreductase n=1 Tax=Streptomyces sp. 4F14 TaxID=3394380 RepID=UPI003A8C2CCC